MAQIIFQLDELEDLKNRLESIIQRGQKIDSNEFKKLVKQNQTDLPKYLDPYEREVFQFIRNSPGTSNQDVVDAGIRSRGPVYKIINNLVKYDLVIKKPDPTNKRRCQLFEKKESLIVRIENDIKNFKRSYLNLLKRVNQDYQKKRNLRSIDIELGSRRTRVTPEIYSVYVDIHLETILEQLIKGYAVRAIFEWPEKIKDSESLNRLYLMVFHMLGEIFSDHVRYSNPWDIQDEQEKVKYIHEGLQDRFGEVTIYQYLIRNFDKYNWNTEFDLVMSDLFTALNTGRKWKDYRRFLAMAVAKR